MAIIRAYRLIRNIGELPLLLIGAAVSLLSIPNPLVHLPFGIIFGFIPLFIVNYLERGLKRFRLNFLFFEIIALALLFPLNANKLIYSPNYLLIIMVFTIIAAAYSINFSICANLSDVFSWDYSPLVFGISWFITQKLLSTFPFTFTFPIELSLYNYPIIIQSAKCLGGQGIGAIIIFINSLFALALIRSSMKTTIIVATILIVIIVSDLTFGYISMNTGLRPDRSIKVAMIQSNKSVMEYYMSSASPLFRNHCNMKLISITEQAMFLKPDIIIWPECSKDYVLQNDEYLNYLYRDITSKGPGLLIGTNYIDRPIKKKYNIAFILQNDGNIKEVYKKDRLVPFVEAQAYSSYKNSLPLSLNLPIKKIGTMICLESVYPQISKRLAKNGAEILICISTDASFGNSMIPYMHAASMVFRAIENNRYAVHVGNTGPSLACDNKGRLLTYIPYGRTAFGIAKAYN
jgi:apolipoprotein N-acyltransferase